MEFFDVLDARRSVRHFKQDRPIADHEIRTLLRAGTAAPSAGNVQPWRFTVVRSAEARERVSAALGAKWVSKAPIMIVVSADPRQTYARYGDRGDSIYAIQDTAAAAQNILLTAVAMGLAGCWIGAFSPAAIKEACDLHYAHIPYAVLLIGASAESGERPKRRPIEEISKWI